MTTNEQVQQIFYDYMDGEEVEWQLLKIFFHQNGGFSRKTADREKALGMTVKDSHITVSTINLREDEDGKLWATEEEAIELTIDNDIKHRMIEMVNKAYENEEPLLDLDGEEPEDPEHDEDMFA